jgi:tRNA nucleotidyltransferase/poly(A) polymerase
MPIKTFEVGGCVRDDLRNIPCNDVDLLLVGAESFEAGIAHATGLGLAPIPGTFKPEFATFKAAVPKGHDLRERCKAVDFVLARKDGFHSDGRRPDSTEPGTLEDDLRRRDFTVNALARNLETGEIVDLFGGQEDLRQRNLRFVGPPLERIKEDGLRVLRGFRFQVTKGLIPTQTTMLALRSRTSVEMLNKVSVERVREEMEKMLKHSTLESLALLGSLSQGMQMAIFRNGLRLSASLKKG